VLIPAVAIAIAAVFFSAQAHAYLEEDESARCPDVITQQKNIPFDIVNVGPVVFPANANHLLQGGPSYTFGWFKPDSWNTAKAGDGSVWIADQNSEWTGTCQCFGPFCTYIVNPRPANHQTRITVSRVRQAPPPQRPPPESTCIDPNEPGCDPGEPGGDPWINGDGDYGYSDIFSYASPFPEPTHIVYCLVTDWYDSAGNYLETTLDPNDCWIE